MSRAFKFLRACLEDLSDDELDSTVVDICHGSGHQKMYVHLLTQWKKIGTLVLQVKLVM